MTVKTRNFSTAQLTRFLELQQTSFDILQQTAMQLKEGQTEKEIANGLVRKYRAAGAGAFFHLPVVLFGPRTALPGAWTVANFFPKQRALQRNDSVILDAAPLIDGYLVDTSYSCCFGHNPDHDAMMLHLADYRDSIPAAVNRGETFLQITQQVRERMHNAGYEPVHQKHPGEVLGHRAIKTPNLPVRPRMQGFDAISLGWFKLKDSLAMHRLGRESPLWNAQRASDHPAHDGLWLVEPHAGQGSVGAKWEEILVIENGCARWLEESPPHVEQWAAIQNSLH